MSNCIKDLFDYDLVKKCSKCGIISLKSNFHKDKNKNDGLYNQCRFCFNQRQKQYDIENRDKKRNYYNENCDKIIKFRKDKKDKINEYFRRRRDSDLNYKIACNLRTRTSLAFKSQNVRKTNKTFNLLGYSHSFFKGWILQQLYGDMTEANYGSVWTLDHCYLLSKTNLSDKNEIKKSTYWINIGPMYCSENISQGDKINPYLCILQEIKAEYFLKLSVEGG